MKAITIAAAALLFGAVAHAQAGSEAGWSSPESAAAAVRSIGAVKAAAPGEQDRAAKDALAGAAAGGAPVTSTQQLLDMRRKALEDLYRSLPAGPIPDGKSDGRASREPGTVFGKISEAVLGAFWQGKVFDRAHGQLINRLTTGEMVKAKVFYGESWLDGKPSIIIDYKDTSNIAGFIRDEIREAAPGIYIGFAYMRQQGGSAHADIIFALDFNAPVETPAETPAP
jgi:hypothetical protein